MSKNSKAKRDKRKAKPNEEGAPILARRRRAKTVNLGAISDKEYEAIIPVDLIESALGSRLSLRVVKTKSEVTGASPATYNAAVQADTHRRFHGVPLSIHPFAIHESKRNSSRFADLVQYTHNQVRIEGHALNERCVLVHLACTPPSPGCLYLANLELSDPRRPAPLPLDSEHRFLGFGRDVSSRLVGNLASFAQAHGIREIFGYAADETRAKIFQRRGFQIDTREMDLLRAAQLTGHQFPLVIHISNQSGSLPKDAT